jgi:hypothetical protein
MSRTITIAELYGDFYEIRADWTEASSPIERGNDEDGWIGTGNQVADFAHDEHAAMRHELRDAVRAGGDDPDDIRISDEIEEAIRDVGETQAKASGWEADMVNQGYSQHEVSAAIASAQKAGFDPTVAESLHSLEHLLDGH